MSYRSSRCDSELGFIYVENELPDGIEVLKVLEFDATRKRMSVV